MERKLSPEEQERIRLLSDGEIYQQAIEFAKEQEDIIAYRQFGHQVNGLEEHARSFKELEVFVDHQKNRNWEDKRQSFEGFYTELANYLNDLRGDVKDEYGLVSSEGAENQTNFFAGLLAREFVQHLAAEMKWQAWRQGG
jgi:hypothetical protein